MRRMFLPPGPISSPIFSGLICTTLTRGACGDKSPLGSAMTDLTKYIDNRYRPGQMSHMNPGSLADWPLTQQKELFSILGNVEAAIGVTLTDGMAMVPTKSTSGIYFATEIRFESCQLCPNEGCIGRRAPYDPDLAKQYQTTTT